MLAVEKENLLAETNREIAALREMELRYYLDHIGGMQTMATLLAGFAFTALINSESLTLSQHALSFQVWNGKSEYTLSNSTSAVTVSSPTFEQLDIWGWFSFLMHTGQLVSVVLSLGEMLHVITGSLIARLLGSRLALRGPDGSIIRATRHLASALGSTTRTFFAGLQYFILSVVFYVARGQHPLVALLLIVILFHFWRGQGVLANKLTHAFRLTEGVNTAFAEEEGDGAWRGLPRQLFERKLHRWGRAVNSFLSPVGSHLKFLYEEVSQDFEGHGIARAAHRKPTDASRHLIHVTEQRQMDASNHHTQPPLPFATALRSSTTNDVDGRGSLRAAVDRVKDWAAGAFTPASDTASSSETESGGVSGGLDEESGVRLGESAASFSQGEQRQQQATGTR